MDGFYGDAGAGSGPWKIFKASGTPAIDLAPVEGWPKGPSVRLHGNNAPFDAGIYQQVAVKPGTGYKFQVAWAVEQLDGKGWQDWYQVNRRLGIDPYGGTNPNASTVEWTGDYFANGKFDLELSAYARAPTITVFIRVSNPYTDHVVDVFLDTATLHEDAGTPPIQVTPPTATPAPTQPPAPTARPLAAMQTIERRTPTGALFSSPAVPFRSKPLTSESRSGRSSISAMIPTLGRRLKGASHLSCPVDHNNLEEYTEATSVGLLAPVLLLWKSL